MRFYIDEDLTDAIASVARGMGIDVISVHEVRTFGLSDDEQLRYAIGEHRCLVTRNRRDFLAIAKRYIADGLHHTGILLVTQSLPDANPVAVARALVHYAALHPVDVIHHVDWLHPTPSID